MSAAVQIVLVTCPQETAPALARALVEARLAACVNIVPAVRSVYRWQDAVQEDSEALLVIKAPAAGFEALKQAVLARHPYELPEVVAVNVIQGHAAYLDWILSSCR